MRQLTIAVLLTALLSLACASLPIPAASALPPEPSVFDTGQTAYGFFPTPPEATLESVLAHFEDLGRHADFVLLQPNVPWEDVAAGIPSESPRLTDIRNQVVLAHQNGLDAVFVVDPLNGLNRREFLGLPEDWEASFANPEVRASFTHFSLWIVEEFQPRFLGLASEINTYADAHPDDFPHYLSLYQEVYATVKRESPDTQVFVTFQWEDLNNLIPTAAEGRTAYETNWDQIEAFEPQLDLWVISSYPFVAFPSGAEIPDDYYAPLLSRTDRPLAVAEGGYTSLPVGPFPGSPQDQVDYLNAIHWQIGSRLRFWVYLLLSDFDLRSYAAEMRRNGLGDDDINTLGMFSAVGLREADGSPKPALAIWDAFRARE
jgi:hypothetical protein